MSEEEQSFDIPIQVNKTKNIKHKSMTPVLLVIGLILFIVIGIIVYFLIKPDTDTIAQGNPSSFYSHSNLPSSSADPTKANQQKSELREKIEQLNMSEESLEEIDVSANNYNPGTRNDSYTWDNSLFYSLEEIYPDSDQDGQIYQYTMEKKQLRNTLTNQMIEYQIYRNPASNCINKIVSIEKVGNLLEVVDYYYTEDEKVNFIFKRNEINYIPSYANQSKDGERYYFNQDVMVKWRIVLSGEISNIVVGANEKNNTSGGTSILYKDASSEKKAEYDKLETEMLNAAYNTYSIVTKADSISYITGYVYDESSNSMNGVSIKLFEDGKEEDLLYEMSTSEDGSYKIYVPSEERTYQLVIEQQNYQTTTCYNIAVNNQLLGFYQESAYLIASADYNNTYNAEITISDAFTFDTNENRLLRLENAEVILREGMNNRIGEIIGTYYTDAQGVILLQQRAGMYTIEVNRMNYSTTFATIYIGEQSSQIQLSASPVLEEDEIRIVLSWGEYPFDLDSHLFTPYDISSEDTSYHIWFGHMEDANYNCLDVDDTTSYGPETVTIHNLGTGYYKYYVVDYSDASGGYSTSYELAHSNACVRIYSSDGLIKTFYVPANEEGVIWEVFEIRGGTIIPCQRCYSNLEENTWWNNEK